MQLPLHGGDLDWARAHFPDAPQPWLDLSTGINPRPYPVDEIDPAALTRLPGRAAERAARDAIADYLAIGAERVALAPGTESLIRLLARLRPAGRVEIVAPTYGGHADAWRAAGHRVEEIAGLDWASGQADVVVAVSPNNPDGRRVPVADLAAASVALNTCGGWLVVDQAFADLDGTGPVDAPGVICLRSFGKFFGLPGLRLGFAVADPDIIRTVVHGFGAWPVNGPALAVAARAYRDADWIGAARKDLAAAAKRLDAVLAQVALTVAGGTDLFRLVENGRGLFLHLARRGILTRAFDYNPGWLRIGLPGAEADWDRLQGALAEWRR